MLRGSPSPTSPSARRLPAAIWAIISHSFLMALAPGSVTSRGRMMGHPLSLPCPAPKSSLGGWGGGGEGMGGGGEDAADTPGRAPSAPLEKFGQF